ncbi:TonB-linked SusC/RagA family outer membrane protein [Catalinimonas alkaloidigena]|uniref:SusC/RagA family TonB-linked outer membrane protein n=1 Tax=Catalinimonas alkaloidigena TaxID=1075417 RepID=UPI002406F555|nr:SusC/RagA family TonB-linked outer membrane protein [Catalinimonas alkaloidigena]MDF9799938.1 TonB-linked SusC/RagA family outer membrane protein [Catalinimonas alkaloidigena]
MKKSLLFFICFLLLLSVLEVQAQTRTVRGKVISGDEQEALPGVNVLVQGTTTGTVTDIEGNYAISVSGDNPVLVFTSVGFESVSEEVNGRSTIDVVLMPDLQQLGEIVVTALGIAKEKRTLTYSTQEVSSQGIEETRPLNVTEALSGKVAGIAITTTGAGVGAPTKVVLRGNRSLQSNGSQPLYVVDGIPVGGSIADISPDNIASISVLKGGNAAALYGSRANNGAIIVTTKSGENAPDGVTANLGFNYQVNSPILLTKYQNEYAQGSAGIYSPMAYTSWGPRMTGQVVDHWSNDPDYLASVGGTYALQGQPDNVRDFFQTGHTIAASVGVNIKNENSNTHVNYTYSDGKGIIPQNNLQRHYLSLRNNTKLHEKLTLDTKVTYIRSNYSDILFSGEGFDNPMRYAYILPRNIRTQDLEHYQFINEAGQLRQHFYVPRSNEAGNPYWTVNNVKRPQINERVLGLVSLKYQITDDLSLLGRSGIDRSSTYEETFRYVDTYIVADGGDYSKTFSYGLEWNSDVLLSFQKDLTENISLGLNAGANLRVAKAESVGGSGANFSVENLFALGNTLNPRPNESYAEREQQSVYAFGEIGFYNAIFLSGSFRNDWSSTLPEANRSYSYPSVGLTAVISDLVDLPSAVSFLKLRGSWAEVGNDTDPYRLSRQANVRAGTISLSPTLPLADLKPERTTTWEAGFDARFLDDNLRFDFTYYKSNTFDQLFATNVPVASGVSSVFLNGADIQNQGVEIVLGITPVTTPNFSWDLNANFAKNISEVVEISDDVDVLIQGSGFLNEYRIEAGEPFGNQYSRGFARDDDGNVLIDSQGLPVVTAGKTVPVANFNPDFLLGLNNTFKYKNFSLRALVDMRQGGQVTVFTEAIMAGSGLLDYTSQGRDGTLVFGENIFAGETAVLTDETGAPTETPNNIQMSAEDLWNRLGGRNTPVGEAFIRDASNIRLRELSFSYNVPESTLSSLPFRSASLSVVGRNLFFFSNKTEYFDPEAVQSVSNNAEGLNSFAPPTTRSFGVSLKLGF